MKKYIPYIIIAGLLLFLWFTNNKIDNLKLKNEEYNSLVSVLNDSIKIEKLKNGELEYSKKAFNTTLKMLMDNQAILSDNQKKLVNEIKDNKNLISAMRAEMTIGIKDLKNDKYTKINDTTINFKDSLTDIQYSITVSGIIPVNPKLTIDSLILPNEQTVEFEWDKDKATKVKVKNSNKYIEIDELDGYVIPEIKKDEIKPKLFKRIMREIKTKGKPLIIGIAIGTAIGIIIL